MPNVVVSVKEAMPHIWRLNSCVLGWVLLCVPHPCGGSGNTAGRRGGNAAGQPESDLYPRERVRGRGGQAIGSERRFSCTGHLERYDLVGSK
jgi:hypothetical protein